MTARNLDPGTNPIAPCSVTVGSDGNERQDIIIQGPADTTSDVMRGVTNTSLSGNKIGQDVAVKEAVLPSGAATAVNQTELLNRMGVVLDDFSNTSYSFFNLQDSSSYGGSNSLSFLVGARSEPLSYELGACVRTVGRNITTPSTGTRGSQGLSSVTNFTTQVDGYTVLLLNIQGTYSGANLSFEGTTDGANYFSIQGSRVDSNLVETTTGVLTNITRAWRFNVTGLTYVRINCTAIVSGTVTCRYIPFATGMEPTPNTGIVPAAQSGTWSVVGTGNVASDAVDSGNPVKIGFLARTSDITAVANGNRVDGIADKRGRQVVLVNALQENRFYASSSSDITNTTSTAVLAAGGAGVIYVVTAITVSNMSATVSTRVDILNGTTVIWRGPAASGGGGFSITFPDGIVCTANTALNCQCATTGAAVRASISGHKVT